MHKIRTSDICCEIKEGSQWPSIISDNNILSNNSSVEVDEIILFNLRIWVSKAYLLEDS